MTDLIEKLRTSHSLTAEEYEHLITHRNEESAALLKKYAVEAAKSVYKNAVFIRGLIEVSNFCKNDCLYCGIRRSNKTCDRYRLTEAQILNCCKNGYALGFRTFVLQGGEDGYFTDGFLCDLIGNIKSAYPDCAITLSLGEREKESYKKLYDAGADRYLLRHETATEEHYNLLHPSNMSFKNRMECLNALKEIGFQVGCGFMVGSPFQTAHYIARDLKFIETFRPQMCGIGPFIPQSETPFANESGGTAELTCYLLSVIRLINPHILLPSTTALGTVKQGGREEGILSGANVIMPNLSPADTREKYKIYDNKLSTGAEGAEGLKALKQRISAIGYEIVTDRGDYKEFAKNQ